MKTYPKDLCSSTVPGTQILNTWVNISFPINTNSKIKQSVDHPLHTARGGTDRNRIDKLFNTHRSVTYAFPNRQVFCFFVFFFKIFKRTKL